MTKLLNLGFDMMLIILLLGIFVLPLSSLGFVSYSSGPNFEVLGDSTQLLNPSSGTVIEVTPTSKSFRPADSHSGPTEVFVKVYDPNEEATEEVSSTSITLEELVEPESSEDESSLDE